ncbi:MAG TPA: class I SAM-dependent methyltransferase [Solirubrobacterales bacterium]|nr:class I SAM-dependent methyltransferase [Solirubrobacterales bacterium]
MESKTAGEGRPRWAEIAYEAMAPVYDSFTHQNDYEMWFGLLLPALEAHGLRRGRLLDVGCGSGKAFPPMLGRGWSIHGCDVSAAMLERARERGEGEVELDVADMRELPVFGEFELVWALNDPVNYMLSGEELAAALAGMRANLAPGGLLMFDANTIETYRGFFAEEIVVERDGLRLLWRGRSSADAAPGTIAEATFEAEPLEGEAGVTIAPELHRERHFPESEILAALDEVGLECLEIFGQDEGDALRQPLDEEAHYKAIYIARAA